MTKTSFFSVKGQGTSIGAIVSLISVALVVVIVIFFMTTNNANAFWKFLPTFNSSDDIDDDILEAREMLREANNNPSKIRAYDCKVTEKGVCLNEDDYRMLEAERPIDELIYCSEGDYCFDNKEGCIIEEPENVLLKCYNYFEEHEKLNTDDYRLPKVCENKNAAEPLERNCVCLDEEGYEYYSDTEKISHFWDIVKEDEKNTHEARLVLFDYLIRKINNESLEPILEKNIVKGFFDENRFKTSDLGDEEIGFIKKAEVCETDEFCDFGVMGEGCIKEQRIEI